MKKFVGFICTLLVAFVVGVFLYVKGVVDGALSCADDNTSAKELKDELDGFKAKFNQATKSSEKRSKKKHEKYATLNEVLRGRDEFYEEDE